MRTTKKKYISLATKNAVVYFLLALAGMAALSYLLFQNSAKEIVQSSEQQVAHAGEMAELKFAAFISNVQRDINYLAQSPYLNDFLENRGSPSADSKKQLLEAAYLAMLNSKPDYSQIRLIGVEGNGREVIRAERLDGRTFLVRGASLQEKGSRDYFSETIRLPKGAIFFSPIDLNKEYGKITSPPVPTLRAACPVYMGEELYGIIVINVDLRAFFREEEALVGEKFDLKLVNHLGHFLIHPANAQTFTFEYGKSPFFENDFRIPISRMDNLTRQQKDGLLRENGLLYSFRQIAYPREGYALYLGVGASERELLASFYTWRNKSLAITAVLAVLILFIAFWYMRQQAGMLRDITQTMASFPENMAPAQLPISRNDEIGQLAKSFEQMSAIISQNLSALQRANEEVEQAIRDKDAFLENMSHEIRNPIHSIIGMTHLLEQNSPGRHQRAFIEALKFNSKNLLSLVNDILDFKKLSMGDISLRNEWFALPPLIEEIANSQRFSAVANKLKLELEISPELNQLLVHSDPVRLTQVVNNLLINAIKFTNENGLVSLHADILEKTGTGITARISIRDNGIGIGPDQLAKITERNYTNKEVQNRGIPEGAGLGLPIVVQLLEMFGSKLQIESVLGEGSHFFFDLFLKTQQKALSENDGQLTTPTGLLEKLDVLVMDDDAQVLLLYAHVFENKVNRFTKISDLGSLANLPEKSFDIIISDVHFGKNGLSAHGREVVKLLREGGLFYIVSGMDMEEGKLPDLPPVKRFFKKPLSPTLPLEAVISDVAEARFGLPDTSSIMDDYDHDPDKYGRAIGLLISEWEKMAEQIEMALLNNDPDKFIALRHKLITSVRRLQLNRFEMVLEWPFSHGETTETLAEAAAEIKQMMGFYVWFLKRRVL